MIAYRGVVIQFLPSSYRKEKKLNKPPNQTQLPQHWHLMPHFPILFYSVIHYIWVQRGGFDCLPKALFRNLGKTRGFQET